MLTMIEVVLLAVLLLVTFLYFLILYNNNYWTRKGILQAPPLPVVGNILDLVLLKKCMGLVHNHIYRLYPTSDAVGFYELFTPKLMVKNPALIKQVLVSDFSSFQDNILQASMEIDPRLQFNAFLQNGERWKKGRSTLGYGLAESKVKDMYKLMKQSVPLLDAYMKNHLDQEVEALELSSGFVLNVVSNSVFGIESDCLSNPDAPFRQMTKLLIEDLIHSWWKFYFYFLQNVRNFLRCPLVPKKVVRFVESMVKTVVEAKITSNIQREDYFHQYLKQGNYGEETLDKITNLGMAFFFSGSETSYVPASNALYELAMNPSVQDKLFEELSKAFAGKSELDYEALKHLPYLDKVIKECLRKYPVVYTLARMCTKDTTLDIDGVINHIETGTKVIIPVFSIHRDESYYPEPDVFEPERFDQDNVSSRPQFTFLALGDGPRKCPGRVFGLTQLKLFLSHIVYNYKVLRSDRTPEELRFSPHGYFLAVSTPMWLRFQLRKPTPHKPGREADAEHNIHFNNRK